MWPPGTLPVVCAGRRLPTVGFTGCLLTPGGERHVSYATVSGALAPLGQPCAHTAGTTCPCGASLSRWCFHCKQERTEFFAQSPKEEDTSAGEDSSGSSPEEASAAGTDAEEDGDTGTATPPEPLEAEDGGPSQGASATPPEITPPEPLEAGDGGPSQGASAAPPEPPEDGVPAQGASATPPEPREDGLPSQGASAGGGDSGNGVAAPPSVSGHGGRELPPAGKKKKKKRKTPPQGEGAPAPPVSVVPSAGPDEGEPVESAGASFEPDEREAAEVGSVRQWAMGDGGTITGHVSEQGLALSFDWLILEM